MFLFDLLCGQIHVTVYVHVHVQYVLASRGISQESTVPGSFPCPGVGLLHINSAINMVIDASLHTAGALLSQVMWHGWGVEVGSQATRIVPGNK